MHEPYDDEYDDEQHYPQDNAKNQYDKYFKFDPSLWEKYGQWFANFYEEINGLLHLSDNVWIVTPSNSVSKNNSETYYIGKGFNNEPIYKKIIPVDHLKIQYRKHIESNAKYFLQQPHYYKGLFDILN